MDAFTTWLLTAYQAASPVVVLGDFSIAPDDRDVYDPDAWRGRNLCIALADERGRVTASTGQMMDRAAACVADAEEMWRSPVGGPLGGGIRGRDAAAGVPADSPTPMNAGTGWGPAGVRGAAAGRLAGVDLQDAGQAAQLH